MNLKLLALPLTLAACSPSTQTATAAPPAKVASALTAADKAKIGQKIWQNESGGTRDGLTAWNAAEDFPSLGIGHFIWYPTGVNGPFTESFPQFIAFAQRSGSTPPPVARLTDSPWRSKAEFTSQFRSAAMNALRDYLADTVPLQTEFIIGKSLNAVPKLLAAAPASDRLRISENYRKVATTPNGQYALIDYVNFKGEGTNPTERYKGAGWGLTQVLQEMRDVPAGQSAAREFASAAKRVLDRRIANAPRKETQWRAGWHNRADTYTKPL